MVNTKGSPLIVLVLGMSGALAAQPPEVDYLVSIQTEADFEMVSIASEIPGEALRTGKFLLPALADPSLLGPLFQNVNKYPLHPEFLAGVFPERFPDLEEEEYRSLVERRATRKYFAGSLQLLSTSRGTIYGFAVFTADSPEELLSQEEVLGVYAAFRQVFLPEPLYYAPIRFAARAAAAAWNDPGFPVYLGSSVEKRYQPYTLGINYGRVRVLSLEALDAANVVGRISWQDILVLERAPRDIEGVVAGVITAEEQTELSHLAIRTARRGTPNAFIRDAAAELKPLEGLLVRLEVTSVEYRIEEAQAADAEAWWEAHRPKLSGAPVLDLEHAGLDSLAEMDLSGAPVGPVARFGGKAANFARLQRIFTQPFDRYRETGFAVPVRYYFEFLRSNLRLSAVNPGRFVTFEEYLGELLASPQFQSDPEVRFAALADFRRDAEDDGVVDPALVARIAGRIEEVFGSSGIPVRFRSSSNVEDALEFNGAGLYDSTSACAADDLDSDDDGPSICDASHEKERGIARALKRVWASVWNFRAYEERAYYQIPQDKVGMAVLVSIAFLDEQSNGVAFTGNPSNPRDRRYVVTAQLGEESVVSPEPGKTAEKDLLEVEEGAVKRIERAQGSSLLPQGQFVLSDQILGEVGAVLWHIDRYLPVELGGRQRSEVLFDIELKVEASGNLAVKQVRPFLVADTAPPGPTFELVVPEGTVLCGAWRDGRDPRTEYEAKSEMRLIAGTHRLPTSSPVFPGRMVEDVTLGPGRSRATPVDPGRFRVTMQADGKGNVTYQFTYSEGLLLADGRKFSVEWTSPFLDVRPGDPPPVPMVLDDAFATEQLELVGLPEEDLGRNVLYSSCRYETLPSREVYAELDGGDTVHLEERSVVPVAGSGPAGVLGAQVRIAGVEQEVRDYWRLVYAAQHHNVNVRYWVVLDPPMALPGGKTARIIELDEPQTLGARPAQALYLDDAFTVVAKPEVLCFRKGLEGQIPPCGFLFRRGDADDQGNVNITDVIFLLHHLFMGGTAPQCPDATDFDDDASMELTDAIIILTFLFRGVDLSGPPGPYDCGVDPTRDLLEECQSRACR